MYMPPISVLSIYRAARRTSIFRVEVAVEAAIPENFVFSFVYSAGVGESPYVRGRGGNEQCVHKGARACHTCMPLQK